MVPFLRIDLLYAVRISTEVLKVLWRYKNNVFNHPLFCALMMRLDERIRNPVSKFKSDNTWPPFGQKQSKTSKIGYFASLRQFFCQKGPNFS